jgi:hypothetical protein
MLMPYTFGTEFVRDVLQSKGKDGAFAGLLETPPVDTRQVMEPDTYLKGETVAPLKVPDLDKLVGANYERYDFGGIGEFDVYLLAKLYAPEKNAKDFYANWRGGYYLVVHAKGAPSDEVALLYMSHWDAPEAAQAFAKVYEDYVPNRYPRWSKEESTPQTQITAGAISTWWEGPDTARVQVLRDNSDLLILEGFDQGAAERLTHALLHTEGVREANGRSSTQTSYPN